MTFLASGAATTIGLVEPQRGARIEVAGYRDVDLAAAAHYDLKGRHWR